MKRTAIVISNTPLDVVQSYLPANYSATQDDEDADIVIEGEDNAGWTLDGYVIPRLASGLICAQELA